MRGTCTCKVLPQCIPLDLRGMAEGPVPGALVHRGVATWEAGWAWTEGCMHGWVWWHGGVWGASCVVAHGAGARVQPTLLAHTLCT